MVKLDVDIPEDLDMKIQRLVEDGEFIDYESAVSELLSSGITAHRTDNTGSDDLMDEFNDSLEPDGHNDEYAF